MRGGGQGLEAYPERAVAIVRAFQRPLSRSIVAGSVVAVIVALALIGVRVDERFPGTIGIVVAAVIGALAGLIVIVLVVPSGMRRAFEAYSWLGHAEVHRFRERTGGPVPTGRPAMDAWLATTPSTPAMRLPRIEMLAFVGRFDDARRELDLVPPGDPLTRFEIASLRQYIDWIERDSSDPSEVREAARGFAPGSIHRQTADVTLALIDARTRLAHGDPAWSTSLEAVRGELGWAPWRAVLLDTGRPLVGIVLLETLITAVVAVVLRSML